MRSRGRKGRWGRVGVSWAVWDTPTLSLTRYGVGGVLLEHGVAVVVGDHELRLEGRLRVLAARLDQLRPEGQVGHELRAAGRHDSARLAEAGDLHRWMPAVRIRVVGARCRPSRRTGSCRHPRPRAACTRHPCSPSRRGGPVSKARAVWPASAAEAAARPRLAGAWGGLRQAPSPTGALSG